MQSLVDDGLEQGLNERNSTILMMLGTWDSDYTPISTPIEEVYGYFTDYFSDDYGGYYAEGSPSEYIADYPSKMALGVVDLKTGKLELFGNFLDVTIDDILHYADLANE